MLEHLDNLAEASARAISNIKFDKVIVWENGGANGKSSTAGFLQNIAGSLPPMMNVLKDIGGVELPEALIKLGGDNKSESTNGAAEKAHAGDGGLPPRA
jgi:flotillin